MEYKERRRNGREWWKRREGTYEVKAPASVEPAEERPASKSMAAADATLLKLPSSASRLAAYEFQSASNELPSAPAALLLGPANHPCIAPRPEPPALLLPCCAPDRLHHAPPPHPQALLARFSAFLLSRSRTRSPSPSLR